MCPIKREEYLRYDNVIFRIRVGWQGTHWEWVEWVLVVEVLQWPLRSSTEWVEAYVWLGSLLWTLRVPQPQRMFRWMPMHVDTICRRDRDCIDLQRVSRPSSPFRERYHYQLRSCKGDRSFGGFVPHRRSTIALTVIQTFSVSLCSRLSESNSDSWG